MTTIIRHRTLYVLFVMLVFARALANAQATSSCVSMYTGCVNQAKFNLSQCIAGGGFDCNIIYNQAISFCKAHNSQATYYLQTIQHVNELYCNGAGTGWTNGDVTAATGDTLAATNSSFTSWVLSRSAHATYYQGTNQHVYELYWNGSSWSNGDVTAGAGGVAASSGSGLTSWAISVTGHATYYIGANQHVYELYWNGSTWTNGDITAATGNNLAASNSSLTSWTGATTHGVYFIGANQHIYELYFNGTVWSSGDLTAATGNTLAATNSALTGWASSSSGHAVYYEGTNQHIYELYWNGSAWTNGDVTAATSGALAESGSALTSFTQSSPGFRRTGPGHAVYYLGTNQHVYELFWSGSAWTNGDITAATGGEVASPSSGLSSFTMDLAYCNFTCNLIYYVGANQNVYEMFWTGAGWFNGDLTNTLASSNSALTSFVSGP
jgi:Fungal fucose-specific lectin